MDIATPDEAERARLAVSIACLAWLRHTGPGTTPATAWAPPRDGPIARAPSPPPPPSPPGHPPRDRRLDG